MENWNSSKIIKDVAKEIADGKQEAKPVAPSGSKKIGASISISVGILISESTRTHSEIVFINKLGFSGNLEFVFKYV